MVYLFCLLSVLSVLGVHAIVLAGLLVLPMCFSFLVMFGVLFYLLHIFLCDCRRRAIRGIASAQVSRRRE
jgi:hypothetical protein